MSVLILRSSPSSLDAKDSLPGNAPSSSPLLVQALFPSFFPPQILQKEMEQVEAAHPQGPKAGVRTGGV